MNCCKSPQCSGIEQIFDTSNAESDLRRYQRKGLAKETQLLLSKLKEQGIEGAHLLDIGGGVGGIQHELVKAGVSRVTNVDASPAYSHVARQEAARLGYTDKVDYMVGDFVQLATQVKNADIVTLDRVICCYDDMPGLVKASTQRARRFWGAVFPRRVWWSLFGMWVMNAFLWMTRNSFRGFVHDPEAVDQFAREAGLRLVFHHLGFFWQVRLYKRV